MIKEKNELIKERVELEKGRTRNIIYKLADLLSNDVEDVFDRDNEMFDVAATILEKCHTEGEYEVADSMLYGITKKHITNYMDDIATGDKYGKYWFCMAYPILERAEKLGVLEKMDGAAIEKIRSAMDSFRIDADEWLASSDEDFSKDIIGIVESVDYDKIDLCIADYRKFNGFVPKFSRHTDLKYYTIEFFNKECPCLKDQKQRVMVTVLNGTPEAAIRIATINRKIQPKKVTSPYNVKEHSMEEIMEELYSASHIFGKERTGCDKEQGN